MRKPNGNTHSTRGPGRPEKPDIKLPASAEKIAQRLFENAKPVDPSRRTTGRKKG